MPVHPGTFENLADLAAYQQARRDARELADRVRSERREEHERRARIRATEREQRQDQRELLRELRAEAEEHRANARAMREALRNDPIYDLHRTWGRRIDQGTLYDAQAWRQSGRLVPVSPKMRYTVGGAAKRDVVDWTDVLDRHAQELGVDVLDLPRQFERVAKQETRTYELARKADESRRWADEMARTIRGAA